MGRDDLYDRLDAAILRHPEWSDRLLADAVLVHRQTVRRARARLEASGEIPRLDTVYRRDGSTYPARLKRGGP